MLSWYIHSYLTCEFTGDIKLLVGGGHKIATTLVPANVTLIVTYIIFAPIIPVL